MSKNKISKFEYSDISESERLDIENTVSQLSKKYEAHENVVSIKPKVTRKSNIFTFNIIVLEKKFYKKTNLKICQDNFPKSLNK